MLKNIYFRIAVILVLVVLLYYLVVALGRGSAAEDEGLMPPARSERPEDGRARG